MNKIKSNIQTTIELRRILSYKSYNKLAELLGDISHYIPNESMLSLGNFINKYSSDAKQELVNAIEYDHNILLLDMNKAILQNIKSMEDK